MEKLIFDLMAYEKNMEYPSFIKIDEDTKNSFYSPNNGNWFQIQTFYIKTEDCLIYDLNTEITKLFYKNGKILFLIHPETIDYYNKMDIKYQETDRGPILNCLATSSYRTCLCYFENNKNILFFVKLSLDKEIGEMNRILPRAEIIRSVGISKIFKSLNLPKDFKYFPETLGVIPKKIDKGGYIVRELICLKDKNVKILPFFSIQTEILDKIQNPIDWLSKNLLLPFANQYIELIIKHGIITECHGQNSLIVLDENNNFVCFVFRDLNGVTVNMDFIDFKNEIIFYDNINEEYYQSNKFVNISHNLDLFFTNFFLENLKIDHELIKKKFKEFLKNTLLKYGIRIMRISDDYIEIGEKIENYLKKNKIKIK